MELDASGAKLCEEQGEDSMAHGRVNLLAAAGVLAAMALLGLAGFFVWALQYAIRGGRWIGF